ncbi:hypothetical protein [Stenotrophomonas acidaminiphila]|uniref:hypothetical protein n=1 Tax=Stenotrophomonas acidaminiphila TaxID=128780 RepID=UPI0039BD6D4E
MIPYQVIVEGVFVCVCGSRPVFGFHGTFYTYAKNAHNAVNSAEQLMRERMARHEMVQESVGMFSTYYVIRNIWEVESDLVEEKYASNLGFTLFSIGRVERFFLALRRILMRRFRPWLLM